MILRWLLVLPAAVLGGVLGGVAFTGQAEALRALRLTGAQGLLAPDAETALMGAVAAICTILGGSLVAPRFRTITALVLLGLGMWVAGALTSLWFFPESHPKAYLPGSLPFWGTVLGGVVGVLLVWARFDRPGARSRSRLPPAAEPLITADAARG